MSPLYRGDQRFLRQPTGPFRPFCHHPRIGIAKH